MNDLNMLLSCFRTNMSAYVVRQVRINELRNSLTKVTRAMSVQSFLGISEEVRRHDNTYRSTRCWPFSLSSPDIFQNLFCPSDARHKQLGVGSKDHTCVGVLKSFEL